MCNLVARELHKVAAPLFMYIVQLHKEDWGILHMMGCKTNSPEQWFQLSSANSAQIIGEFWMTLD